MINKAWLRPQWKSIDYRQAEAGNAPFDGKPFIGHYAGSGVSILFCEGGEWVNGILTYPLDHEAVSHYTPMPEFYEGGGD